MGFSWSSCVAQSTLLSICEEAGLRDRRVLACDSRLPSSLDLAFAVATDDFMIFSDAGAGITVAAAKDVEEVTMARRLSRTPIRTLTTLCPRRVLALTLSMGGTGARLALVFGRFSMLSLISLNLVLVLAARLQAFSVVPSGSTC